MCPSGGSNSAVTHRLVFDMKKVGRVFPVPLLPPPPFSRCAFQMLEPAINSSRQAPGGEWATFAVAVPPGSAGESLSFPNMLHLCLFLLFLQFLFYPLFPLLPSLVSHDCLRKMTVPPQLAGLWLTETNK